MSTHRTSGRRAVPVCEWPPADQAAWLLANQAKDPLDDRAGYAQRWRPATRKLVQDGYGYWLDWLARSGQLAPADAPGTPATPERLRAYQEAMQAVGLAPHTVATRVQQVGNALSAIAPEQDWGWLRRGASRLHSRATPTRDKRVGLQPAEDVERLGRDMMQAAEHDRFRAKVERAVLFRDGLLLAMLVARPLRRANVTATEVGRHLQRQGDGWWLCFTGNEMKSHKPFACSVPAGLTAQVDRYLDVHRLVLLACSRKGPAPTAALWISKQGTHMTSAAIAYQITARTREEFGKPINPHRFRHIYATDTAILTPSDVGSIRSGLGHTDLRISERHYNLARMVDAGKRYDTTIDTFRKKRYRGGQLRDNDDV